MVISGVHPLSLIDFPERVACIVFTPGCNFRCRYCYNPEFVLPERIRAIAPSFIPEETFLNFLEQRRGLLDGVVVTGGEPTLQGDLLQFLERVRGRGFAVKLDTNGNNPAVLREVLRRGLADYVAMDVKTSLDTYAALVGPRVNTAHIVESLALLRASGRAYELRSTLIREIHTEAVLADMVRLVRGAPRLYLQAFRPGETLDPQLAQAHPFTVREMESIASRLFAAAVKQVAVRA